MESLGINEAPDGARFSLFTDATLLYGAHFLQTWGDRLWQFAVPLALIEIFPSSIFVPAFYQFMTFTAVFLGMTRFGGWVDNTDRLRVMTVTIVIQNLCIMISTSVLFGMTLYLKVNGKHSPPIDFPLILSLSILIISSMIGEIMGRGATLALEKDWVVVISNKDADYLTILNSRMKRIDLTCKLFAPALYGIFISFAGTSAGSRVRIGASIVFAWNAIGLFAEYFACKTLYTRVFDLQTPNAKKKERKGTIAKLIGGWTEWYNSPVMLASLPASLLYFSLMDGGGVIITAYLKTLGMPDFVQGLMRGAAAASAIGGTFLVPQFRNCGMNIETMANMGIWIFCTCLSLAGINFFCEKALKMTLWAKPVYDAYVIMSAMILSRAWLNVFKLGQAQIMQEQVDKSLRGQISGVQASFNMLFKGSAAFLTLCLHKLDQFYILIFINLFMIFMAAVLFTFWRFGFGRGPTADMKLLAQDEDQVEEAVV